MAARWNKVIGILADHLQIVGFLGVTAAGVVAFFAWIAAAATERLKPYGPLSYFIISMVVFLSASLAFWLIASGLRALAQKPLAAGKASGSGKDARMNPWAGHAKAKIAVWRHIDPLTLEQAACLWAGVEPPPAPGRMLTGEAAARLVQLRQATAAKQLGALRAEWISVSRTPPINVPSDAQVSRARLKAYATRINDVPPFLAD